MSFASDKSDTSDHRGNSEDLTSVVSGSVGSHDTQSRITRNFHPSKDISKISYTSKDKSSATTVKEESIPGELQSYDSQFPTGPKGGSFPVAIARRKKSLEESFGIM